MLALVIADVELLLFVSFVVSAKLFIKIRTDSILGRILKFFCGRRAFIVTMTVDLQKRLSLSATNIQKIKHI